MLSNLPLEDLREIVRTCQACRLHKDRKNAVFDCGNPSASLMIIGEAPGEEEDATGVAFVGKAGQHLTNLLDAARVPQDQYYCANVLKCRPQQNKFPEAKNIMEPATEPTVCRKFLLKQIEQVQPKAILITGQQALRYLLLWETHEEWNPLHPWINKQYRRRDLFGDTRFLVCYHPNYLLRSKIEEDEEAWIQAVAQLWAFIEHKIAGTPPAPMAFTDIRPPPEVPRQGRNLFGKSRGRIL